VSDPTNHLGLLLIDFQEIFLKAMPDRERLLKRTTFALKAAELLGVSVAATEQLPEKLGATTEVLSDIWNANTPTFGKSAFSGLEAEGIQRWIEANQIEHILIAGIETSICVYQTAIQALGEDIGVTLLSDCISERRSEDRAPVLEQLLAMDAHVLPCETIFYSLLGSAEHPQFKAFTQLVKEA
jgi:nicotinamidase-related amidase